jgi:putative salt-induced outer membrane protein YdiY
MYNFMNTTDKLRHVCVCILALFILSSFPLQARAAPKTDIIIFHNGDRLTGEIKSLSRGRLNFNTAATGTIAIEWDKIARIISNQYIQLETFEGSRYFGQLLESDEGPGVLVGTEYGPQTLNNLDVISMAPIDTSSIKNAFDIDVTLGYNFAKAGGVEQGTFGIDVAYRTRKRIYAVTGSTTLNNADDQEASRRTNLGLDYRRLWQNRWYVSGGLNFDRNDELGLELRSSLGAGGGRFLIQSNNMLLDLQAGLQFSREKYFDDPVKVDSVEAIFSGRWDWFRYDSPELDWSTFLEVIPNLSDWGRVRANFDTSLKWEVVSDLKLGISFYSTVDNKDVEGDASSNDYGVNTNVTYEF